MKNCSRHADLFVCLFPDGPRAVVIHDVPVKIYKITLLLAERASPVDYQCRIESLKTQYFIDCRSVVQ